MKNPVRVVAIFAALVLVGFVVIAIVNIVSNQAPAGAPTSVVYRQTQSVPQFDATTYTVRDRARIAELDSLIRKYGVNVASYDSSSNDNCTGGIATMLTFHYASGTESIRLYDCAGTAPKGTFLTDATALVTGWHAADRG